MSEAYDIVIVGAGPVGLMLAACIARLGKYKIKHIDIRPERTQIGRADGIQARSLDILRNMGLKRPIMAYNPGRIYEVAFWNPLQHGKGIHRTGTWKSYPEFIDTRYPFTTILHQGRIEKIFVEDLERMDIQIDRSWAISRFKNEGEDLEYPVQVDLIQTNGEAECAVRTKYLFGADGARSFVREQLGVKMTYKDPTIHMKCTVHSDSGSAMIIPHGNNVVRVYVQIKSSDKGQDPRRMATESRIQQQANDILSPYRIEWDRVDWHSAYPIVQGIAERYTLDQRIFMGGDACHTHSPKAGQGMNYGFLDAQNFAWKFHLVESGFATQAILHTYEEERKKMAQKLIDFDAKYAALFSSRPPSVSEVEDAVRCKDHGEAEESNEFVRTFKQSTEFTSGYGVHYDPNCLNWSEAHPAKSPLFSPPGVKLLPGRVFPPVTVTRVSDACIAHLEQEIPQNGSYRIYIFAGSPATTSQAISDFATNLQEDNSFLSSYRRHDIMGPIPYHERHNPHSLFFTFCTIFNAPRPAIEINESLPGVLAEYRDQVYADDIKSGGVSKAKGEAHVKLGFCGEKGGVVVVRPDGYVGCTLALVEGAGTVQGINEYFAPIASKPLGGACVG
ncbi:hypothetical protein FGG08_003861 [Glutinoglossum americanum]|uniref:Phenol 2-monooxygenase n=1 Tax=Glutinoglossum americanum TaxID=1670608 RepID=A0A9P8IAA8_9PEZI|nr:hypothetical protein FGG08_003861 [Glutinoglossum americanum]